MPKAFQSMGGFTVISKVAKLSIYALLAFSTASVTNIAHSQDNNAPLSQAEIDEYLGKTENFIRAVISPMAYEMKFEGSCTVQLYDKLLNSLYEIMFNDIDHEKIKLSDDFRIITLVASKEGTITEELLGDYPELELETWGEKSLNDLFKGAPTSEIERIFKMSVSLYGDLCR